MLKIMFGCNKENIRRKAEFRTEQLIGDPALRM